MLATQNRDKLGGLLNGLGSEAGPDGANYQGGWARRPAQWARWRQHGSILSGGLGDLVNRFRQSGRGDTADSWVKAGDNAPLQASDLEATLGEDTIAELTQKTGLSRAEVLDRLSSTLPDAVNQMTPEGRLPTEAEASRFA